MIASGSATDRHDLQCPLNTRHLEPLNRFLSEQPSEKIDTLLSANVVGVLVALLQHCSVSTQDDFRVGGLAAYPFAEFLRFRKSANDKTDPDVVISLPQFPEENPLGRIMQNSRGGPQICRDKLQSPSSADGPYAEHTLGPRNLSMVHLSRNIRRARFAVNTQRPCERLSIEFC